MTLRPYQTTAVEAIVAAITNGKRPMFTMPTGTGKTQVFVAVIQELRRMGMVSTARPAIVIAHREELLTQAAERFVQADPLIRLGIEQASARASWGSVEVVVASVQTLSRRRYDITPGVIVIDEAHHAAAASYAKAVANVNGQAAPHIGCTATPKRLDRRALIGDGAMFDEVAFEYPILDAIDEGYLVPLKGYRVQTSVDLDKVKTTAGDFNQKQLAQAVDNTRRTTLAVKAWKEIAGDKRTIVFCVDVAHAKHAAEAFPNASWVSGDMPLPTRRARIDGFRSGAIQVLTQCDIATEGFDLPEIGCVVMLKPTKSWARYVQSVGRGLRIAPGKDHVAVIDVVDNTRRHSLVTVPAILDLPPNLNLQGKTLRQAKTLMDKLGEHAAKSIREAKPQTFDDLVALIEQVNLLDDAAQRPLSELSRYRWRRVTDNRYRMDMGAYRAEIAFSQDRDAYAFRILGTDGLPMRRGIVGKDLGMTLRTVENLAASLGLPLYYARSDGWASRPTTRRQKRLLASLGASQEVIAAIPDAGSASNLIATLLNTRQKETVNA